MNFTFSPLLGILGAAILGGAIGLQRQAAQKPAGFRTHLLVAAASAAFTAMGAHLNDTRIPSYIVVGIGFLGAGAIVRQGTTARGLTTAATIWMAAAIGLLLGYSSSFSLEAALAATLITLIALSISDAGLMRAFHIPRRIEVRVFSLSAKPLFDAIDDVLSRMCGGFEPGECTIEMGKDGEASMEANYHIELTDHHDLNHILRQLTALQGVQRVEAHDPLFES